MLTKIEDATASQHQSLRAGTGERREATWQPGQRLGVSSSVCVSCSHNSDSPGVSGYVFMKIRAWGVSQNEWDMMSFQNVYLLEIRQHSEVRRAVSDAVDYWSSTLKARSSVGTIHVGKNPHLDIILLTLWPLERQCAGPGIWTGQGCPADRGCQEETRCGEVSPDIWWHVLMCCHRSQSPGLTWAPASCVTRPVASVENWLVKLAEVKWRQDRNW